MSMESYVYAIVPPSDRWESGKWKAMKAAYDACTAAGVTVPPDVDHFFNGKVPDDDGVRIELTPGGIMGRCDELHESVEIYSDDDMERGATVDISKLPPGTKYVRFVNSW